MSSTRLWPALALAALLAACGGGDDDVAATTPPPAGFSAETKSGAVGAAGGSVTLGLANGTVFELTVPAGAVKADTTFTLTTQEPVAGQRFNLLLQPAGLVFAQGQAATMLVTLPTGQTLAAKVGLAYRGIPIAFTVRPDGKLQVDLTAFAGIAPSAANVTGRAAALAATRPLATPSAAACGGAPELGGSGEGGLVAADAIEVELYGQCMVAAVESLAANERFSEAVSVSLSVAAYLQRTGSGDAAGFITRAGTVGCVAYSAALDRARSTTVSGMGTLYQVSKPIMFWEKVRQQLGIACSDIGETTYQGVINDKVGEAIAYYESQKPAIVDTGSANYRAAKTEATDSAQAATEVLALNPAPALRSTLDTQIVQRAQPSVLEALLEAPWRSCRNDGSYAELISLMQSLDSPRAVQSAAHYCATQIGAKAKDAGDALADELAPELGGVSAAHARANGTLFVPNDGKLVVSGPVAALKCASGSSGDEGLRIKLNGTVLQTMTPPYFASPLQIDMAQALQAAGIDPLQASQATLTIERIGSPCGGFWGDNPAPLAQVDLSFKVCSPEAGQDFCVTPLGGSYTYGMINAKGQVAVLSPVSRVPLLWEAGQLSSLPSEFDSTVSTTLLDDGSLVGTIAGAGPYSDLATVANGSMTRLFVSTTNVDAFDRSAADVYYSQSVVANPISGQAVAVEIIHFVRWAAVAPASYCVNYGSNRDHPGEFVYSCERTTLFRYSATTGQRQGPAFSWSPTEPRVTPPNAFTPRVMNRSGTIVGDRAFAKYDGDGNFLGYRYGAVVLSAAGNLTLRPLNDEIYTFIDDSGTIYAARANTNEYLGGREHIVGTPPFPPPLAKIGRSGATGDVISCSDDETELQLTNLYSGRRLASASGSIRGNGWTVSTASACGYAWYSAMWGGRLDSHGRSLTQGVDATGTAGTVILTPRGKRLPRSS